MFLPTPPAQWKPQPVQVDFDWPESDGRESASAVMSAEVAAAIKKARSLNIVFGVSCLLAMLLCGLCGLCHQLYFESHSGLIIEIGPPFLPGSPEALAVARDNAKEELAEKCSENLYLVEGGLFVFALLFPFFYATKRPGRNHARWLGSVIAAPALGLAALGMARFFWLLPAWMNL